MSDASSAIPIPTKPRNRLSADVLLCLPSILGTAFFLINVVWLRISGPVTAPDPFREFTGSDRIKLGIGVALFFASYFGAAVGPIFVPFAAHQAFALTRTVGAASRLAVAAWACVVLGVVATALFWGWLVHLDIFI